MRVYIPASFDDLDACLRGDFTAERAYAVTPRLLEISSLEDEEELAEQVRDEAAYASILAVGSPARVVIVADQVRADVREIAGDHPAAVSIGGRVATEDIVCAFVDEVDAVDDAAAAVAGDDDAAEVLAERDLLWWDVSEFPAIPRPAA
ncbi:DUF6912 family protein [Demequina globuliformis]|uniref:DUF6912 family protein n=1 Tax=Demequina globuliformis TaxID=676202 RepID=UPI000780B137|nr:hypothetical protein [Demequina globuliformis]